MARVVLSCKLVNAKMLMYLIWDVANQTFVNYQTSIRNSYVQFGIIVLSTENWFQSGSNGLEMFPQVFESGIFCLLTNWLTDPLTNPSTDWLIQSLNDWLMATSMKWQIAHISTSYLQVRSYIPFEYRRLYKIYQGKQKCTVNRNTHLLKNNINDFQLQWSSKELLDTANMWRDCLNNYCKLYIYIKHSLKNKHQLIHNVTLNDNLFYNN